MIRSLAVSLTLGLVLGSFASASAQSVPGFERTPLQPDRVGGGGAPNVAWVYPGAPRDGLESVSVSFLPVLAVRDSSRRGNAIYWAYNSQFSRGQPWYMGIQPNSGWGHKVLFSVFGKGASSVSPNCKSGADGGPGVHCHLTYPWKVGNSYTMRAFLVGQDDQTRTWRGTVRDDATGTETLIGEVTVARAQGLIRPHAVTFSEYYRRNEPCADRPLSEVLLSRIAGDRAGRTYPARLRSLNANGGPGGCNTQFFGDHADYVYIRQGTRP